ncbi:hypothetical protein EAH68_10535 [Corynebacterium hylobatis]|uniref:Heme peroxidase n=1 Tax=Corynebacterium hylobatis TaxID=1859290 RepID=A0A3R9ZYT4_9CORY|nr:hypothetical protein [Corynebacterium hylobatis]RSZ61915.1 hypothetical protein EAH68_10535 [Corynebacterium hylobatis]
MNTTIPETQTLIDYCEKQLGDPILWRTPAGYPDSLAMCLIDALYSPGSSYKSVVGVMLRYRVRHPYGGEHGAENLLQSITEANGPRLWAEAVTRNVDPAETSSGVELKSRIIQQGARLMIDLGLGTVDDLHRVVADNPRDNPVRTGWLELESQSAGITYDYLLMLAGLPASTPDWMVLRFLAELLGQDTGISLPAAHNLLRQTASRLEIDPGCLHHIIWRAVAGLELRDLPEDMPTVAGK